MAQKIYKRIGIQRDSNLGDLSDKTLSLNNLLDTLAEPTTSPSTFISEDLDAIRNIFSYGLSSGGYRNIIGSRVEFTNSEGENLDFSPRITYQNKLDKFKIFSGIPRINGGNGLTAKYYNSNQVINPIPITGTVFTGTPIVTNNFWENGNFSYSQKITPESVDTNGGVEWSGYFIPTTSGSHTFSVNTTALMSFEFETEGYTSGIGTYTEHSRIGLTTTLVGSASKFSNTITLAAGTVGILTITSFIGIGQSVSGTNIRTGTTVDGYNRTTGVITLTPPVGFTTAITDVITNGNIVFSKAIGQDTRITYSTYVLEAYRKYNIRARYYIPSTVDAIGVIRNINFDIFYPGAISNSNLRYNYLYASDYNFSDAAKGKFNVFLDNSILSGGGTLGKAASSDDYVKVKSTKKVDITYAPKSSYAGIEKASRPCTTTNGTKIISISDTSGIEVGNYIFGTGVPTNTVVTDININAFITVSNASTASDSVTLTFIDHRGFVKRVTGSASGTTLTISSPGDTTNLKTGMVVIGSGTSSYTGITITGSANTVTISPSQSVGAGTTLYFYQSRGLINEGLAAFCVPGDTTCIFTTSPTAAEATILNVTSTTGVANGMRVLGAQFASNTTVSSFTSSTITINKPTTAALASGGNFTVTNTNAPASANDGDRDLCCPPTDTSPPFSPTEDGLETTSSFPNLKIDSGNVKFSALTATVSAANITNISSTDSSTKRIPIQTPSVLKLLDNVGAGTTTILNILCA